MNKFKTIYISLVIIAVFCVLMQTSYAEPFNYEVIIPPSFNGSASDFIGDLAIISHNQKFGIINKSGKVIVPLNYDKIFPYDNINLYSDIVMDKNYFKVYLNKKIGLLDKTGKLVVPCVYSDVEAFNSHFAIVKKGKYCSLFNLNTGKLLYPDKFQGIYYCHNEDVYIAGSDGGPTVVLDQNGKIIVPAGRFDTITSFRKGIAVVNKKGKYGVINKKGKLISPMIYDDAYLTENCNFVIVVKNKKYGILSISGKIIKPLEYSGVFIMNGMCALKRDSQYTIIDQSAKEIVTLQGNLNPVNNTSNLIFVVKGSKLGAVDLKGNIIIPVDYLEYTLEMTKDDLAIIRRNSSYVLIGSDGKILAPPGQYDYISFQKDGNICVSKNGLMGLLDKKGNKIFDCEFSGIGDFYNNHVVVCKDGEYAVLDALGKEIIPYGLFDEISLVNNDDYLSVKKNNLYGFIKILIKQKG